MAHENVSQNWALDILVKRCPDKTFVRHSQASTLNGIHSHLSLLQRLLLVNTSERKKREAGALERENGSAGNDRKREKASFFPSQRSPRALIFPSSQPPRVPTQRDCRRARPLRRREYYFRLINNLELFTMPDCPNCSLEVKASDQILRKVVDLRAFACFSCPPFQHDSPEINALMHGSILPVTIAFPGTPPGICNFVLTWRSIPHPRARRKRQFPTPGTPHLPQIRCFVYKI